GLSFGWGEETHIQKKPAGSVPSRFYLRLMVKDVPGVLGEITRILANHKISISSVIQHEAIEGEKNVVPLIIMTHTAPTGSFTATIAEFDRLSCVVGKCVYYPVGD